MAELIDKGTETGVESRLCSAIKTASYYLEAGLIRTWLTNSGLMAS
jgi:hypothetical protein